MRKIFVCLALVVVIVSALTFNSFADFVSNAPLGGDGWDTLKECHNGYTILWNAEKNKNVDTAFTISNGNRIPLRSQEWEFASYDIFYVGENEYQFSDYTSYDLNTNLATHMVSTFDVVQFIDVSFNPFVWTSETDMYFCSTDEDVQISATIVGDVYVPQDDGTYQHHKIAYDYEGFLLDLDEWDVFDVGTIVNSLTVHLFDLQDTLYDLRFSMVDENVVLTPVYNPNTDISDGVSFFESVFGWVDDFFNIELFGNISLGLVLGVLIVIPLAIWVLKVVAGG